MRSKELSPEEEFIQTQSNPSAMLENRVRAHWGVKRTVGKGGGSVSFSGSEKIAKEIVNREERQFNGPVSRVVFIRDGQQYINSRGDVTEHFHTGDQTCWEQTTDGGRGPHNSDK